MRQNIFFILFFIFLIPLNSLAVTTYEVQDSTPDGFIINDEYYDAKHYYCSNVQVGDQVVFLQGAPGGDCTTAKLYDVNDKLICDVWCE